MGVQKSSPRAVGLVNVYLLLSQLCISMGTEIATLDSAVVKRTSSEWEQAVEKLSTDKVLELGVNIRLFSLAIRSLFVENAVSSSEKFIKLRNATRNDAIAYLEGVMPINKIVVSNLQQFFEYYQYLTLNEWQENLEIILNETRVYRRICETMVDIHEDILINLKQREDEANTLSKEFTSLHKELQKKKARYSYKIRKNFLWAATLVTIPVVNVVAIPLLIKAMDGNTVKEIAAAEQQEIMYAAIEAVGEVLLPALRNFIAGLETIAGFFNIMENELQSFERAESRQLVHYKVLKKKAVKIQNYCRLFQGILPSVTSDLKSIPANGTDRNYVDKWLARQKNIINRECKATALLGQLCDMV